MPEPGPADALAQAWSLKDQCYEAWNTAPARAAQAAAALRALADAGVPAGQATEVGGLADWTEGIACLTRGEMAAAVLAFDRAAGALRAAGRPDPAAQTQVPKIIALSMLGQHADATACAEAAQRELRKLGNLHAAARVSLNLGNLLGRRDAYADAARHFREAAVLFARLRDHAHSVLADIGLAAQLTALGDFDEGLRVYARARMRAENQQLTLQLALVDESVALLDLARGRYSDALAHFESARRRYATLGMPQYLAIAEKQLADTYLELRLLPEALALFDAAVDRFGGLQLPDEQAWALAQRGRTQALLGQAVAAAASFAAAAALFADQGNAVGQCSVMLARAELALTTGDAAGAGLWAAEAAQGFSQAGQADGRARAEVVRAHALLLTGEAEAAATVFHDTLASARELQQLQVQVRCLTGQGLAAQALGKGLAAQGAFEAAIALFEEQRRALPDDDLRNAFLADHLRPYQERLRMAVAVGDAEQVLLQLERFRARSLVERLHGEDRLAADAPPGGEIHRSDEGEADPTDTGLRERLNWLYRRVQRLQHEDQPSATLQAELLHTERALLERARRRRLAAPVAVMADNAAQDAPEPGTATPPGKGSLNLTALQAALQPGDALVEYGVVDDELFACTVTHNGVQLHRRLAAWPAVLLAVQAVRFQIEALSQGTAPVRRHLDTLARRAQIRLAQLHTLLWSPLQATLDGARRVLVVPYGPLGGVPFGALIDGTEADPRPLGQHLELALAPSASAALHGLLRTAAAPRRVLALGESSRLPHAGREAGFVAALFGEGQAFVGSQATLASLHAHAGEADVLHLACHAQFRSDNPRFSALHLYDGALTVELAEALVLKPCTVVLSACETGLAQQGGGDEMVGLARAFLVAGAARVLGSLWPVDDAVVAAFMAVFYGALARGDGPGAALRQAQVATAAQHPHPYFWSAFTLYGGW